jgi:hypothetical protein
MFTTLLIALLAAVSATAQDDEQAKQPARKWQPSRFERFLLRKDALIVSQSFTILRNDNPFWDVSAKVAWE